MELKPTKCWACGKDIEYFMQDEYTMIATHRCEGSEKPNNLDTYLTNEGGGVPSLRTEAADGSIQV